MRAVLIIRHAISPRLAIKIDLNINLPGGGTGAVQPIKEIQSEQDYIPCFQCVLNPKLKIYHEINITFFIIKFTFDITFCPISQTLYLQYFSFPLVCLKTNKIIEMHLHLKK